MPELPEVETVVRDLRPLLNGRTVCRVVASDQPLRFPWQSAWADEIIGRPIEDVQRRGKWILIVLAGERVLLVHLGMTGQLTLADPDRERESHTHLVFELDQRLQLRFRDIRRFGSVRYCHSMHAVESMFGETLGPEPWAIESRQWLANLRGSRRSLKAILLDQSVVAGVGNIYADESLFLAGLCPSQPGTVTTPAQAERLRQAIVTVLDRAIAARGSTIRNYVGGSGLQGGFQHALQVYGRTGEPCVRCREPIVASRLAGRSTHWCPRCQKPRPVQARR